MESLEYLDLTNNKLTELPSTFVFESCIPSLRSVPVFGRKVRYESSYESPGFSATGYSTTRSRCNFEVFIYAYGKEAQCLQVNSCTCFSILTMSRAKVMIVGDAKVGKTALASALSRKWIPENRRRNFPQKPERSSSDGIDISTFYFDITVRQIYIFYSHQGTRNSGKKKKGIHNVKGKRVQDPDSALLMSSFSTRPKEVQKKQLQPICGILPGKKFMYLYQFANLIFRIRPMRFSYHRILFFFLFSVFSMILQKRQSISG